MVEHDFPLLMTTLIIYIQVNSSSIKLLLLKLSFHYHTIASFKSFRGIFLCIFSLKVQWYCWLFKIGRYNTYYIDVILHFSHVMLYMIPNELLKKAKTFKRWRNYDIFHMIYSIVSINPFWLKSCWMVVTSVY